MENLTWHSCLPPFFGSAVIPLDHSIPEGHIHRSARAVTQRLIAGGRLARAVPARLSEMPVRPFAYHLLTACHLVHPRAAARHRRPSPPPVSLSLSLAAARLLVLARPDSSGTRAFQKITSVSAAVPHIRRHLCCIAAAAAQQFLNISTSPAVCERIAFLGCGALSLMASHEKRSGAERNETALAPHLTESTSRQHTTGVCGDIPTRERPRAARPLRTLPTRLSGRKRAASLHLVARAILGTRHSRGESWRAKR
eukprot:354903-Chlamydomonas_euryale.AAC.17